MDCIYSIIGAYRMHLPLLWRMSSHNWSISSFVFSFFIFGHLFKLGCFGNDLTYIRASECKIVVPIKLSIEDIELKCLRAPSSPFSQCIAGCLLAVYWVEPDKSQSLRRNNSLTTGTHHILNPICFACVC